MKLSTSEEIVSALRERQPRTVAIDGRPCSGKTTLATKLSNELSMALVSLDDFVVPFQHSNGWVMPGFPFRYFRYGEFLEVIRALSRGEQCSYHPYDWASDAPAVAATIVDRPAIIEGVSALNTMTRGCIDVGIYVQSDEATMRDAVFKRSGGRFTDHWETLWFPSEAEYHATQPWARADFIYAGRGL